MRHISYTTRHGAFRATFTRLGLAGLTFPGSGPHDSMGPRTDSASQSTPMTEWVDKLGRALEAYFEGRPMDARQLPPLDFLNATPFRISVWRALLEIPYGRTATYGGIADSLNRRGAARAVGSACGANPIPLVIPCHRVLGSGGSIGGFSAGLDWKILLLQHEQSPATSERRSAEPPLCVMP